MTELLLDVRGVSRRYGSRLAVEGASFALRRGQIACLLGASGCGKSTLLRMIAGLEPVDTGEIGIDGATMAAPGGGLAPEERGVGLVFQDLALFPHLSVADNVRFGMRHVPRVARAGRIAALLERFQAAGLADQYPHTLSGGEQQRVAIARAMAREPALLLLDEPFSGLDGQLRAQVRASVLDDLRAAGATVLIVTHDPEEAMAFADELILMAEGRILQNGTPESCYRQPVSEAAARLLGEVLMVPAIVRGGNADTALGRIPAPNHSDGPARFAVRPEDMRIADAGAPASVSHVRFGGSTYLADIVLDGASLAIPVKDAALQPGATVRIAFDTTRARPHLLPHDN